MSGESDTPNVDADPIDVDYEPALPKAQFVDEPNIERKGPGWAALGVTGVLAALLGGGIGGLGSSFNGGDSGGGVSLSAFEASSRDGVEAREALGADVQKLRQKIAAVEAKISAERAKSGAEAGESAEDLTEIRTQQEKIEKELRRFDADLERLNTQLREAGDSDAQDFDRLAARLESLERVDKIDGADPREVNRGLKSLERRLDDIDSDLTDRQDVTRDLSERLDETNAAIKDLEAEIEDRFEASADADNALDSEEIDALKKQVSELQTDLDDLADDLEKTETYQDAISDLRAQSDELQDQFDAAAKDDKSDDRAALLAMISIEGAARGGQSFQSAYEQLTGSGASKRAVAKLRPFASQATPTLADLQSSFGGLREEALNAVEAQEGRADRAENSGGALGWMQNVLGDAIVVRRSGKTSGVAEGLILKLDAAQAALAAGDLAQAIDMAERLDASARDVYSDWLEGARERQKLDAVLEDVRTALADKER